MEDTQQGVLELEELEGLEELEELEVLEVLEVLEELEEQHTLEVQVTLDTRPEVQDTLEELVIQLEV